MENSRNKEKSEEEILLEQERPCKKKARTFSVKEFRNNLKKENISPALQQFHELCFGQANNYDYILEYLQKGGSCLELLQLMEINTDMCHLILEIVYFLILEINSKYPQYTSSAHDASKYFLNTYMTMANKMLSLNSSYVERTAILNFLTAVVSLSPNYAKDILIYIHINTTNIGFLVNRGHSKNTVRNAFISFLMAFLVDGFYPTISALLEKRGLITSILKGLVYDTAEMVCIVLNTLKYNILENPLVSKTLKMRTFSTPVVKDIVQLYNWKGPVVLQNDKVFKKRETEVVVEVDQHEKSKVSSCVHDFLLILCTSNKYGVIFKDPQVGLGRKTQNSLIYTVLESLDSPWKHSYASELVVKICGACPDLTKTVWVNLKPSLEPRHTEQWLYALNFAGKLFKELIPSCIDHCIKDLTPHQVAQVTQMLVAPTQILKILTSEEAFNQKYLKYNVIKVLTESIRAIELYLNSTKNATSTESFLTYRNLIKEHISRNFPNSTILLANYEIKEDDINELDYLDVTFQLLSLYQKVCPQLLDFANPLIDFRKILDHTRKNSQENVGILGMKIIKLYLGQDSAAFLPNTDLFKQVMPFILDCYCRIQNDETYQVLERIFLNTGIFVSSESEVRVWINSLTNVEICTESINNLFVCVLKMAFEKSVEYVSELSDIKNSMPEKDVNDDVNDALQQLCSENDVSISRNSPIKHVYLSSFIIALFEYSNSAEKDKILKSYLQYAFLNLLHKQTDPNLFFNILQRYKCEFLSKKVLNYITAWYDGRSDKILTEGKGKLELFSDISTAIMNDDISTFLNSHKIMFKHDILNLLDMFLFYVVNLAKEKCLTRKLLENCVGYIKYCEENEVEVNILNHPVLLNYFSPLQAEKENTNALITNFVVEVVNITKRSSNVLEEYRVKLYNCLQKMFRKPSKYKNFSPTAFLKIINTLNLNADYCFSLLEQVKELNVEDVINNEDNASFFTHIITYLLNSLNNLGKNYENILNHIIIEKISDQISFLISKSENLDVTMFIKAFTSYLEIFPHCLDYIKRQLFVSIMQKEEYNKECVDLSLLLLKSKLKELMDDLMANVENVSMKKGVILPILNMLSTSSISKEYLKFIFDKIEPIIVKALQKPQKAGQHFERHYIGVELLINNFFSIENCKTFLEKIQKFESTEVFHVRLLKIVFAKVIKEDRKYVNNSILIYVHLCMNIFKRRDKTDEDWIKLSSIIDVMKEFFDKLPESESSSMPLYSQILQNETFKTFWKFCLKFGLSNNPGLLSILSVLVGKLAFTLEDSELMLEMIGSHSEFLDWMLNEGSDCKTEILNLMLELFKISDKLMTRQYLPILLAAYRATLRKSDRIIFAMLKMFEAVPSQTSFYDFKPFLWGRSAANHYSIRSDVQKALWRQPRTGSILDILEEHLVLNTINRYPLSMSLKNEELEVTKNDDLSEIYDLSFLLPLFTLLLAPENAVQTYRFTKSGALSLTITALCCKDKDTRSAACFVLSRFYHHIEARQNGKDNQLWLRFIDAICKGIACLDDLKLNKFTSVFLARMSLILTQPTHIMYVPLSQYLSAKSVLDFSSVPELYTLLHSSDVNFRDHRNFILEIIRDGLVSSDNFHVALRSVSFKLIMDQYSSAVTDSETKLLILKVIDRASNLNEAIKFLCLNYGMLPWLYQVILDLIQSPSKHLLYSFKILYNIVNSDEKIDLSVIILLLEHLIDNFNCNKLSNDVLLIFFKILSVTFGLSSDWLSKNRLEKIITAGNCKESAYILKYGGKYIQLDLDNLLLANENLEYYIKFLTLSWIKKNL